MPGLAPLHLAAGVATLWRLSRWQGWTIRRDRLLGVLHLGYLLAASGFLAAFGHSLWPEAVPQAAVVHIWAIGAIGIMTLAMMTRATLGHTGQALRADRATQAAYLFVFAALVARIGLALRPDLGAVLLTLATACWSAAFLLFLARYGPNLLRRG